MSAEVNHRDTVADTNPPTKPLKRTKDGACSGACGLRLAGSASPAEDDTRLDSILRSGSHLPGNRVAIVMSDIPQNPQIHDLLPKNLNRRT